MRSACGEQWKNLDDGSVLAVCGTEWAKIENLVQQIRDRAAPAVITDIMMDVGSPATGLGGFKIKFGDTDTEMLTTIFMGTATLRRIDKKQDKMLEAQKETNAAIKSVDGKMDSSLKNDAEILKVLRGMRGGDVLCMAG